MTEKKTNPLRFGVLSYARIARDAWLPALGQTPLASLTAIGVSDPARRTEAARRYPQASVLSSYQAVIDCPDVQAVYIPLPNHLHAEWAVKALEKGLHVLCEKPLAHTAKEAARMKDAAAASGRVLMEAFMYRHSARMGLLKQLIAAGSLGHIRNLKATFCFNLPHSSDYRFTAEHGGGALLDVGIYGLDLALTLFPGREWELQGVSARMHNGVDLAAHALLESDGLTVSLTCGFDTDLRVEAELQGTTGTLIMPGFFLPVSEPWTLYHHGKARTIKTPRDNPYRQEIEAFVKAVHHKAHHESLAAGASLLLAEKIRKKMGN